MNDSWDLLKYFNIPPMQWPFLQRGVLIFANPYENYPGFYCNKNIVTKVLVVVFFVDLFRIV